VRRRVPPHNTAAKERREVHQKVAAGAVVGPIQTVVALRMVPAISRCAARRLAM
jgi:hypothetical protein